MQIYSFNIFKKLQSTAWPQNNAQKQWTSPIGKVMLHKKQVHSLEFQVQKIGDAYHS